MVCTGEFTVLIACAAVSDRPRDSPDNLDARGAAHVLERLALLLHGVHPLGNSLQLTLSDEPHNRPTLALVHAVDLNNIDARLRRQRLK